MTSREKEKLMARLDWLAKKMNYYTQYAQEHPSESARRLVIRYTARYTEAQTICRYLEII